jgi:hypothetical protein
MGCSCSHWRRSRAVRTASRSGMAPSEPRQMTGRCPTPNGLRWPPGSCNGLGSRLTMTTSGFAGWRSRTPRNTSTSLPRWPARTAFGRRSGMTSTGTRSLPHGRARVRVAVHRARGPYRRHGHCRAVTLATLLNTGCREMPPNPAVKLRSNDLEAIPPSGEMASDLQRWSGRPDLIPYGCSRVKPPGPRFRDRFLCCFRTCQQARGRRGWRAGAGGGLGQVMGLTVLLRGREDRGRGGSPRLSGLVVAV